MRYITQEQYEILIDIFNEQQNENGNISMDNALSFAGIISEIENQEFKNNIVGIEAEFYCELSETSNNEKCLKQCGVCKHKDSKK